ncbi:hypothetical protein Tco_0519290 [Tanacetum coccineum]
MDRNRKAVALEEITSIEKKIDEGSASPSDTENHLNLLHELEKIDKSCGLIKVYYLLPAHNRCGSLLKKTHSKNKDPRLIKV